MLKKFMHVVFLSCLKATELIEKRNHVKLSFGDRLRLKMHLAMCSSCANYEEQSLILEQGIKKLTDTPHLVDMQSLKMRIESKIKELQ